MFIASSPVAYPRLGVVVPRHRQTIVKRNRLKRRIKEIGRNEILPRLRSAEVAVDVMVRARPEAYGATFAQLLDELTQITEETCSSAR